MDYEEYEDLIIERLAMPGAEVSALPSVESLSGTHSVSGARIYVIYNGSTFADPEMLGATVQRETLNFEIFIRARTRRGDGGVFPIAEAIKCKLLGWKPKDAFDRIKLTGFGYVSGIQSYWQYQLNFSFTKYVVQLEEPQDYGTISKLSFPVNY